MKGLSELPSEGVALHQVDLYESPEAIADFDIVVVPTLLVLREGIKLAGSRESFRGLFLGPWLTSALRPPRTVGREASDVGDRSAHPAPRGPGGLLGVAPSPLGHQGGPRMETRHGTERRSRSR